MRRSLRRWRSRTGRIRFWGTGRPKKISSTGHLAVPAKLVERRIYLIRGEKVMLDADLAELYQVRTKRLNEAVRRNLDRFPEDFRFQLTDEEAESLRSQFATSNTGRGGRRYLPYAFPEHSVATRYLPTRAPC